MLNSGSDLRYFLEVTETLNLSRAAERIGITQPSLTLAIQRLEDQVGVPLLSRSRTGVVLTPAGKLFKASARDLLGQWEQLRARAVSSRTEIQGRFTVGCHTAVASYALAPAIPDLLAKHRGLELRFVHDLSRRILERVIQREIDVGIVINPVRHPDLVLQTIARDRVTLWKKPSYKGDTLICDPDLLQTQAVMKKLRAASSPFKRVLETPSLEVVARLTADGAGIGILPGRVARAYGGPNLKGVLGAPAYEDELHVVTHTDNRGVRAIQAIAAALKDQRL